MHCDNLSQCIFTLAQIYFNMLCDNMITIVLELYMSKRNWKNIYHVSCCERSEANFLGEKLALVPLNLLQSIQTFSSKYTEQEIKDYPLKFQGRSPKFKDFSRTNSFSRTFQGKAKIQGLFKDCGNPE